MRFVDPPSLDSPARGRPGDDLDGLLSAFFRSEMPDPWPSATIPEEAPRILPQPMPARRSLFRSRLALAASVAILLVAPWMLSGSFKELTGGSSPNIERSGSAIKLSPWLEVDRNGKGLIHIRAEEASDEKATDKKISDDVKDILK